MLDDLSVIAQKDPHGALQVAANEWRQLQSDMVIVDDVHDGRPLERIVLTGMGGSALAGLMLKDWLGALLPVPFEVVRDYNLPGYVNDHTLVIASSYSGNTEETLSCLQQARDRFAQVGAIASGGKLVEVAEHQSIAHVLLPAGMQPRMAMFANLRALVVLLVNFGVIPASAIEEVALTAEWLHNETSNWLPEVTVDQNEAKQLALLAVGKTPVVYSGMKTGSVAYKWKISWNETAKNMAFWNQYSEFNHNEFMGWTSHPIEKPFAVFDIVSNLEHPQILRRFEISDRLLSGKRPKAHRVVLKGDTLLQQLLWGCMLGEFVSIYGAILNGVDPVPVGLIEKLKQELA